MPLPLRPRAALMEFRRRARTVEEQLNKLFESNASAAELAVLLQE